ncbi:oligopeptide ABC transporter permease [Jiangella asiatica]|uniref:oligopeptide ABC transporter permease n=1 Tax=Jiangella asiatica TaxID=2530372 RepID=UPI00193CB526|nr:oligopeptide ABC transporter permease [Jiangella asiatica]
MATSRATVHRSPRQLAWRRFQRNKLAVIGAAVLILVALAALLAPWIARHSPTAVDLTQFRQPPSAEHWLGTDSAGRDVFARLLHAGRISLFVGLLASVLAIALGTVLGALAGLVGGWIDMAVMRSADIVLAFPSLVVIVVLAGVIGPSVTVLVLAIAAFEWPTSARVVRAVTLSLREREYLQAAKSVGASRWWLIRQHIIPAALPPVVVVGTVTVASAVLLEAALSFLGLGVPPPQSSWGNMLNDAQNLTIVETMPWLWLPPGIAVALTVLAVNFVGDGLRDAVDPRQRTAAG